MLGLADEASRSFGVTHRRIYQKSLGLYVQDTWKVKPNFTLEAGVRWDVAGALGEAQNQGSNFLPDDPKADADGFVSLAQQPLYKVDKNNFGPRVGFAWDLFNNGKTVVRAGYSLSYDLPNFGTIHAPQTFFNAWTGTRSGFFTQVPQGIFGVSIASDSGRQSATLPRKYALSKFYLSGPRGEHLRTKRYAHRASQRGAANTRFSDSR